MDQSEVRKIAHLARLSITEEDVPIYAKNLTDIFDLVAQMDNIVNNIATIKPMAHPIAESQRLRPDVITEINQRELFQSIVPRFENGSPCAEAGLYLVPQVIE